MRHLVKGRKLGRTHSHRKATLSALAIALIHERRITTTVQKAKELRTFIEPLITRAKVDSTHNRRLVFSKLNDKYAVTELFEEVGPKAKDRPGGYTRVLKLGFRQGDAAELAVIELVDYNDVPPELAESKKKKTRRAGRSKKTTSAEPVAKTTEQKEEKAPAESKSETVDKEAVEAKEQEDTQAETEEKAEAPVVEAETSGAEEKTEAEDEVEAKAEAAAGSASDFTVDEVKEKLDAMSVEEAKAFVGDDERVTVQRALQKKIDDAEADDKTADEKEEK